MARPRKIIWPDAYLEAWDGIRQIDDAYQTGNLREHIRDLLGHARDELDDDSGESDPGAAEESSGDTGG